MENSYVLSKRAFLGHCIMNIVKQAPNNMPRKLDKIIIELSSYYRENTKQFAVDKFGNQLPETSIYVNYLIIPQEQIKKIVDGIDTIPEIAELNLSNNEYKNGVGLNDERPQFAFCDRYSTKDADNDFIDLLALKRNIFCSLMNELEENKKDIEVEE